MGTDEPTPAIRETRITHYYIDANEVIPGQVIQFKYDLPNPCWITMYVQHEADVPPSGIDQTKIAIGGTIVLEDRVPRFARRSVYLDPDDPVRVVAHIDPDTFTPDFARRAGRGRIVRL